MVRTVYYILTEHQSRRFRWGRLFRRIRGDALEALEVLDDANLIYIYWSWRKTRIAIPQYITCQSFVETCILCPGNPIRSTIY